MRQDPRAMALLAEYGIRVVDRHRYPEIGQTRAVETVARIIRRHGGGHMRLVLTTLAETANNKALLDEVGLWSASDLVRACAPIVAQRTGEWLDFWDACPVGELQLIAQGLSGTVPQRHALTGMIFERIARRFGTAGMAPDLFMNGGNQ